MKVRVRYFGMITEIAEKDQEEMNIEGDSVPVDSFRAAFINKYPALKLVQFQVAVNRKIMNDGNIWETDEIALLPPFSGG